MTSWWKMAHADAEGSCFGACHTDGVGIRLVPICRAVGGIYEDPGGSGSSPGR